MKKTKEQKLQDYLNVGFFRGDTKTRTEVKRRGKNFEINEITRTSGSFGFHEYSDPNGTMSPEQADRVLKAE